MCFEDNFECGCCVGLALGYLLFGSDASGAVLAKQGLEKKAETEVVQENNFLLRQIQNYQANISPRLKEELKTDKLCKHIPSCSEYAKEAIGKHGEVKGTLMALGRLARCNPLSKGGYDPVK